MANVLLHVGGGALLWAAALAWLRREPAWRASAAARASALGLTVAVGLAAVLIWRGNLAEMRWALVAHAITGGFAVLALLPLAWGLAAREVGGRRRFGWAYVSASALLSAALVAAWLGLDARPSPSDRIVNPLTAPASMDEEGARTFVALLPLVGSNQRRGHDSLGLLPGLGRCAAIATRTSTSSGRDRCTTSRRSTTSSTGSRSSTCSRSWARSPSKWCAGCHDHAVFFNGRFDRPIAEQIETPEAQAGLACTSCHSISQRGQLDGQWRVHHCLPAAAPARVEPPAAGAGHRSFPHLPRSRTAPPHVHEAVHAPRRVRVLRHLPQGAPRRAGQRLPLDSRLQRIRQLAGQRRLWPGRAIVLLPRAAVDLRGLPHAPRGLGRSGPACRWDGALASLPGARTPRCRSSTTTPSS